MKTTVIYHSADYDGIFCREIARKFLPEADFQGWNFGQERINATGYDTIYILDLPPDVFVVHDPVGIVKAECFAEEWWIKHVIWIDHHKTSIEKWADFIPGYRIDGVAACRLAWQWFSMRAELATSFHNGMLSVKEEFVNRIVLEPLAVLLAGEYDIWDKRDPRAETFQYALRCSPITPKGWDDLLSYDDSFTTELLHDGEVAQRYAQATDASICKSRTWLMEWEGLKFLCINSARFNSLVFAARDVPETGHDALLGFCFNGKVWTVSLYHAKHRIDLDLSEIAKRYGGGGHRGACGFTCDKLPWMS